MINTSQLYKQTLFADKRNFNGIVDITLANGTVLPTIDNATLRSFSTEDAVSVDESFSALGSAIINELKISINNIDESYSYYDFYLAEVVVYIELKLLDGSIERFRKGTYRVDDTTYSAGQITLYCLDNMSKFDKPYSLSTLVYPATLNQIVDNACSICDVTLYSENVNGFPHNDFVIDNRPDNEYLTFREVIAMCAQIAGCFARCDTYGRLELKWFDQDSLELAYAGLNGGTFDDGTPLYESGDRADGGTFNPWNVGDAYNSPKFSAQLNVHNIYSLFTSDISTDDVVVTQINVLVRVKDTDESDAIKTFTQGLDGYALTIEDNELITESNAQQIVQQLGQQLIGLRFRKLSTSHTSDPSIEAGDVAVMWDRKGRSYPFLVTRTNFSIGQSQTSVCGAETPAKNSAIKYTQDTKNYVTLRQQIIDEKTDREQALNDLSTRLNEKNAMYTTVETDPQTGEEVAWYLHDQPLLTDSAYVWKMTTSAWGVSTDGGRTWNAGMTVDGDTIVRILQARKINADWITTGILQDKGGVNSINLDTGEVVFSSSTSAGKLIIRDGYIETRTRTSAYKGIQLYGESLNIYSFELDGTLIGRIRSTYRSNDTTKKGVSFRAEYGRYLSFDLLNENSTVATSILSINFLGPTNANHIHSATVHRFQRDLNFVTYVTDEGYRSIGAVQHDHDTSFNLDQVVYVGKDTISFGLGYYDDSAGYTRRNTYYYIASDTAQTTRPTVYRCRHTFRDSEYHGGDTYFTGFHVTASDIEHSTYIHYVNYTNTGAGAYVEGNFGCSGQKYRTVDTKDYGKRNFSAYETASPYFGDIGTAILNEDGQCIISIDPILLETVNTSCEYCVFLQKEGQGDLWVKEKSKDYFIIEGTPNLKFSWELKAKQLNYENDRLVSGEDINISNETIDYGAIGYQYVQNYYKSLVVNPNVEKENK